MKILKLIFWACFTLGLLTASVSLIGQNTEPLTISFFYYSSQPIPKWLLILGSALVGAILASIFFVVELIVLETKNIRLRRTVGNLERTLQGFQKDTSAQDAATLLTPINTTASGPNAPSISIHPDEEI